MRMKVREVKFDEPSAVRCACGQLCANPATHQIHAKYCQVVLETGVMFGALKLEDFEKANPPRKRAVFGTGVGNNELHN